MAAGSGGPGRLDAVAADGREADQLLAATLARLPASQHPYLIPARASESVPLSRVADADWLRDCIDSHARRWPAVDRRVRATLWWYSVSQVFLTPAVASAFTTGRALSPRPGDVWLHLSPDGGILTAASTAVLDGDDLHADLAGALRDALDEVIPSVARAGARRERPLWAIAVDSLANRLLWIGRALGEVDRASALARTLARSIGEPMPAPRYVDIDRCAPRGGQMRFVRRASCCLVYLAPGELMCASCPRLTPEIRAARLRVAADFA